jgi:hypothetical protein
MDRTQVNLSSVAREELRSEQAFPVSLKPLYGSLSVCAAGAAKF